MTVMCRFSIKVTPRVYLFNVYTIYLVLSDTLLWLRTLRYIIYIRPTPTDQMVQNFNVQRLSAVNYFRKMFHLRLLIRFSIRL